MTQSRFHDISKLTERDKLFIRRRSSRSLMLQIILSAFIAMGISFVSFLAVTELVPIKILAAFTLGFVCLVILLMLYTHQLASYLFSNEFENALFAGAANTGMEFMLIIKQDQQVVYYSPNSRNYLKTPKKQFKRLDSFLENLGIEHMTARKIIHAVMSREARNFDVELMRNETKSVMVDFVLEPIRRPRGFCVIKVFRISATDEGGYQPHALTRVFDEMNTGIYKASEEGVLYYVNPAFADMLGYEQLELMKENIRFRDLVFANHVLDEESFNEQWEAKVTFKHKDGHPVAANLKQLMLSKDHDLDQGLLRCGFVVSKKDAPMASVRKQSNLPETLAQSITELWSRFLETSPIGIVLMDTQGNVTETNAAFRKLAGKKLTDQQHLSIFDIVETSHRNDLSQLLEQERLSGRADHKPLTIPLPHRKNGTGDLYVNPIEPAQQDEENPGFIGYLIDTSEQKQLENKMIHSQKMQAVGQLAGGIAHDFNNLLTAMIGFCDLLLMRHPPGEQSFADIMQIKQNANRAAGLVRQLLAFSRKQTLQPEVVDITDTIADLSNLLRRLIGENIELKIRHGRDLWKVKADTGQLEQVIINLAVNARDAMEGKGVLTIRTSNRTIDKKLNPIPAHFVSAESIDDIPNGDYVAIEVQDTGCGMPKKVQEQIFEPFFTTKELGKGTGLGLSTVLGIIEQTGGFVLVSSKVNQGTTFMILLKRYEVSADAQVEKVETKKVQDLTGSGKILLVEDEAPVRLFASRALKNKGYDVLVAEHAEDALRQFAEHANSIDMIISDVMMPGISGPEMVQQLLAKNPDISVIFISGYGEDEFIKTFGDTRDFEFLPKPFTLNQLASKVKDIMESRDK